MNKNYHFNVKLERFAYLTGRSLATFKRDFEHTFNSPPGRWLQKKRLEQAYYLITRKGKTASDVYLELGLYLKKCLESRLPESVLPNKDDLRPFIFHHHFFNKNNICIFVPFKT